MIGKMTPQKSSWSLPVSIRLSRRHFLIMSAAATTLGACAQRPLTVAGLTMGTSYRVIVADPDGLGEKDLRQTVDTTLAQINKKLSNWDPDSELSRLNAATTPEPMAVSPDLATVMATAEQVHTASTGGFDVTLAPLIDLWGFGPAGQGHKAPAQTAIDSVLAQCGQARCLQLAGGRVQKRIPQAQISLSAIGKGYGVDAVARKLDGLGLGNYMVEIGGDLYTAGLNPDGRPWQIGIETPLAHTRTTHQVVELSTRGLATSGDYRNSFTEGDRSYSHILDPRTGRPVTHNTASVSVVAENTMLADAWATALLVLGQEQGQAVADRHNIAALFITRDATGFTTTPSATFRAQYA